MYMKKYLRHTSDKIILYNVPNFNKKEGFIVWGKHNH